MLTSKKVFGRDFFFLDENSVAVSSFLQHNKNAISAYFFSGKNNSLDFFLICCYLDCSHASRSNLYFGLISLGTVHPLSKNQMTQESSGGTEHMALLLVESCSAALKCGWVILLISCMLQGG